MRWPLTWKFAKSVSTLWLVICAFDEPATAEQLVIPVSIGVPSSATIVPWGSFYSWIDGSQQTINFLNPTTSAQIMAPMWAATRNSDPIATGYGMRGAMGFVVPEGTIQLMSSHVSAGALQGGTLNSGTDVRPSDPSAGCAVGCLDGLLPGTSYESWQTELKAVRDLNFGPVVASPFATLFGKNAKTQLPISAGTTNTDWTDLGGTIGVDTTYDIAGRMLFGLRGSVGTAYRATSFALVQDGAPQVTNSNATALLATAEASFVWKPQLWQTIKAYAGVQFDSHTPLAPNQLNDLGLVSGPVTYESVPNYYLGASLKMQLEGLTTPPHF